METIKPLDEIATVTLGNGTIKQFAKSLRMTFINKKKFNGNVCFVNSDELRSEYKDLFTQDNLYDYLYAVWYSVNLLENQNEYVKTNFQDLPIPTDKNKFWELVELGEELRQIDL